MKPSETAENWQLDHYARIGKAYGEKHFTRADSEFTNWILGQIAAVQPSAQAIAEIGAGTCIFASLLGKKLRCTQPVLCFEPVAALLEGAAAFENVESVCGGGVDFARQAPSDSYDLVYTKDTAHHFSSETLHEIHEGICDKLVPGGRYAMVVRTPPHPDQVPVGQIAAEKWGTLYTGVSELLESMNGVEDWKQIEVCRWEREVMTPAAEWIDGISKRDTWSIFSALSPQDAQSTVEELKERFEENSHFPFLHQYDVAVFQKS